MSRAKPPARKPASAAAQPPESAVTAELAEAMLSAMSEGVIVFGLDGRPIYANERSCEISGLSVEQRLTLPFEQIVATMVNEDGSPEMPDELPSRIALRTGRPASKRHGLRRPDGALVWVDVDAAPIFRDGALFGCCLVMRDVTERRAAAEALRASEEMKSAVMAASVDAILTIDSDGKIVDLNRAAERLYKTTRAAVGDTLESFIPWRDRQVWAQILERLQNDPKHFRGRRLTGTGQ
ncbi:MAG TPA: PAS domain-containing protein, partial [Solirubrobacteraceae bacterium]|nr:PAS domain-containing protein [Solirubrobacteraceae bacterium]